MPDPLTRVPLAIVKNTSVAWRFEHSDFDPADGWGLDYSFEGPASLDVAATTDGAGFLVEVTEADTDLVDGFYIWQAFASRTGPPSERVQVDSGRVRFVVDLNEVQFGSDEKTHVQIMCEALEAQLQGRASDGQLRMTINGRSIDRIPILEVEQLFNIYRRKAEAERAALAQGARPGKRRRIKARF